MVSDSQGLRPPIDIAPDTRPDALLGASNCGFQDNADLPGFDIDSNSVGGALQAGADIAVTKNGYINLDVKKIRIDTTVKTTADATVAEPDIDPAV